MKKTDTKETAPESTPLQHKEINIICLGCKWIDGTNDCPIGGYNDLIIYVNSNRLTVKNQDAFLGKNKFWYNKPTTNVITKQTTDPEETAFNILNELRDNFEDEFDQICFEFFEDCEFDLDEQEIRETDRRSNETHTVHATAIVEQFRNFGENNFLHDYFQTEKEYQDFCFTLNAKNGVLQ